MNKNITITQTVKNRRKTFWYLIWTSDWKQWDLQGATVGLRSGSNE